MRIPHIPESERGWMRTLAVLWLAEFIALMGMSLVMPFLPLYLTELHVPDGQVKLWAGWVGGANFLMAAIAAPLWGVIADRFGRKPMAVRALFGLAVAVALMGFVQNVYQLFALRMLQGAFGGFVAAAIALAGSTVPRERLGAALGFLQTAVVGGHLVGPLLGGELSHWFGYRDTFRITGGALVVAALLVIFLVREQHSPPEKQKGGMAAGIRELLAIPSLRWVVVSVLLAQSGLMLVNPQVSLFVRDIVGDSANLNRLVGLVIAAPALTSVLAATIWGREGDRRGHAKVLSVALAGAAIVALPVTWAQQYWQVFLARLGTGVFTAAMNPSTHSAVAHVVHEERTASAFSLVASAQMLGACIGPFLSGPLAQMLGVRALFPITAVLLIFAAFAARAAAGSTARSE